MEISNSQQRAALPLAVIGLLALILRVIVGVDEQMSDLTFASGENARYSSILVNTSLIINILFLTASEAFAYFTMTTNTLALFFFLYIAWGKVEKTNFVLQNQLLSALLIFLTLAALIYHILLSAAWQPTGLRWVISFIYHTLMPLLAFVYWCRFNQIQKIGLKQILLWYCFPVIYLIYIFTRGAIINVYPYPFLNIVDIGTNQVVLNIGGLTLLFLLLTGIFWTLGKLMTRRGDLISNS